MRRASPSSSSSASATRGMWQNAGDERILRSSGSLSTPSSSPMNTTPGFEATISRMPATPLSASITGRCTPKVSAKHRRNGVRPSMIRRGASIWRSAWPNQPGSVGAPSRCAMIVRSIRRSRSASLAMLSGLTMYSNTPSSRIFRMIVSSRSPVSITTWRAACSGDSRRVRSVSRPSITGICTSRNARLKTVVRQRLQRLPAVSRLGHLAAEALGQHAADEVPGGTIIIDEEHLHPGSRIHARGGPSAMPSVDLPTDEPTGRRTLPAGWLFRKIGRNGGEA